ncbi:HpcH/HpaI aldolase/citrate lyase family protein [Achromobacter sp. NPDC058515]|uniref:HpcH/HpaI aldolase/citrate lyase family protein n=1 Tax=Achromobacter sp. NPDC058515 TaxID=3346533 RepID=UPI003650E09D
MLRSLLFVPATAGAFVAKAHERGADAVIVDLEDSILPELKESARLRTAPASRAIARHGIPVLLRVNVDPQGWREDLLAADLACLQAVVLPKVESAAQVIALSDALGSLEKERSLQRPLHIAALVESPLGVVRATDIASCSPRLCALGFGAEDYAAAMSVSPEPMNLRWAAQQVTNSARAFGLGCWGLADSIANLNDMDRFESSVREARNLGFTGSVAIHPRQVPVINRGFSPSAEEREWARQVVLAAEAGRAEGRGVVILHGRMVDQPLVDRARRWLAQ